MKCQNCGSESKEGAVFCTNCGIRFEPAPANTAQDEPVPDVTAQDEPAPANTATVMIDPKPPSVSAIPDLPQLPDLPTPPVMPINQTTDIPTPGGYTSPSYATGDSVSCQNTQQTPPGDPGVYSYKPPPYPPGEQKDPSAQQYQSMQNNQPPPGYPPAQNYQPSSGYPSTQGYQPPGYSHNQGYPPPPGYIPGQQYTPVRQEKNKTGLIIGIVAGMAAVVIAMIVFWVHISNTFYERIAYEQFLNHTDQITVNRGPGILATPAPAPPSPVPFNNDSTSLPVRPPTQSDPIPGFDPFEVYSGEQLIGKWEFDTGVWIWYFGVSDNIEFVDHGDGTLVVYASEPSEWNTWFLNNDGYLIIETELGLVYEFQWVIQENNLLLIDSDNDIVQYTRTN